ncbi:unnamed protein product [Mesocestoides corti]|uniref:Uncharacterized protein n=1 Tax=Mesocestoides corti TaxID=53468 RepID=A0A0R3UNZ1_MESCO|nr:unnamed protein product [Mesocestoides corti]
MRTPSHSASPERTFINLSTDRKGLKCSIGRRRSTSSVSPGKKSIDHLNSDWFRNEATNTEDLSTREIGVDARLVDLDKELDLLFIGTNFKTRLADLIDELALVRGKHEELMHQLQHRCAKNIAEESDTTKCQETELTKANEEAQENALEKRMLKSQALVIEELTANIESLKMRWPLSASNFSKASNSGLEDEVERLKLAHSLEMQRLFTEMSTMDRDVRAQVACLERQLGERSQAEDCKIQLEKVVKVSVRFLVEIRQNLLKHERVVKMTYDKASILRQIYGF